MRAGSIMYEEILWESGKYRHYFQNRGHTEGEQKSERGKGFAEVCS